MSTSQLISHNALLDGLLARAPIGELGPGDPDLSMRSTLKSLRLEQIVQPHPIAEPDMASLCCAALWLRWNFLDEAHGISQSVDTAEGSYWHAIVHRREPDFANAKYWLRRAGPHAIHEPLAGAAKLLAADGRRDPTAAFLQDETRWDAMAFVDLCEAALDGAPALYNQCRRIQLCEWELLFEHCWRRASGNS